MKASAPGCNVFDRRELFHVAWPLMKDELQRMNARPEGSAAMRKGKHDSARFMTCDEAARLFCISEATV